MTSAPENFEDRPTTAETRTVARTRRTRRRRAIIATVTTGALVIGGGSAVAISHAYKTVDLDVDGETQSVSTFAGDIDGLLTEQGVDVTDRDLVSPGLGDPLNNGADVVVRTGKEVDVEIDGDEDSVWVTAADANEALNLLNQRGNEVALVASRSDDRAELPLDVHAGEQVAVVHDDTVDVVDGSEGLDALLTDTDVDVDKDDLVTVQSAADADVKAKDLPDDAELPQVAVVVERVDVEKVTKTKDVEHDTKTTESSKRYEDLDPKVKTEGEDGTRKVVREITTVDGKEIKNEKISSKVTEDPVTEVLVQGTKERPEPEPEPEPESSSGGSSYSGSTREIGQQMAADRGWTGSEWTCLESLWTKESGWSHTAANPTSSAYGIPQALPGSKMASAGADWQTNPATQIAWGLEYIAGVYGSPCGAWSHSQANNWY